LARAVRRSAGTAADTHDVSGLFLSSTAPNCSRLAAGRQLADDHRVGHSLAPVISNAVGRSTTSAWILADGQRLLASSLLLRRRPAGSA